MFPGTRYEAARRLTVSAGSRRVFVRIEHALLWPLGTPSRKDTRGWRLFGFYFFLVRRKGKKGKQFSFHFDSIWKCSRACISLWQAQFFFPLYYWHCQGVIIPTSSLLHPRLSSLRDPHLWICFCGLSGKASLNCQGLGASSGVLSFEVFRGLKQDVSGQELTISLPNVKSSIYHSFRWFSTEDSD